MQSRWDHNYFTARYDGTVDPERDRWLYRLGMALNYGAWIMLGLWAIVGLLVAAAFAGVL